MIKKIAKQLKKDDVQFKLMFWFLVLQPFLDCFLLYSDEIISIFKFSPTTLIRLFFIGFLGLIVFTKDKSKKNKIIIISYMIFIGIYTIIHHIYTSGLNIVGYDEFYYSVTTEFLYILRMLLPIGILYMSYQIKFKKEDFIRVVKYTLAVVSFIIIALNIFEKSLSSYSGGWGYILGNIFDWFSGNYEEYNLSSKGWFNSANQISGLFMLLFPFAVYDLFDNFDYKKLINITASIIAMIMLGTRVSVYGWILVLILIIAIDIFMIIFYKHKFRKKTYISSLIVLSFGLFLVNYAPIYSEDMQEIFNENDRKADNIIKETVYYSKKIKNNELDEKEKKEVLKTYRCLHENGDYETSCLVTLQSIGPAFYKTIYPVDEHEDFWLYFLLEVPIEQRFGQRNIQKIIASDINNNQKDKFTPILGLGYSRFIRVGLYPEHDFYVHSLTIGIVGIILLILIYPVISVASLIYMLIKKKFNFLNLLLSAVILEVCALSYVTGHIMDELIVTLFLGFISGFLLKRTFETNNEITKTNKIHKK